MPIAVFLGKWEFNMPENENEGIFSTKFGNLLYQIKGRLNYCLRIKGQTLGEDERNRKTQLHIWSPVSFKFITNQKIEIMPNHVSLNLMNGCN